MRYLQYCLFLCIAAIATTLAYFQIEKGWVAFRLGENDFARSRYDKASFHYLVALKHGIRLDELFNHLAESARVMRSYKMPEELLRQLSKEKPQDLKLRKGTALFFAGILQYDKAAGQYQEILEERPEDADIRLGLAALFAKSGDCDQAILEYKKAFLTKKPLMDKSYLDFARLLVAAKRYEEAEEAYRHFLKKNPSNMLQIELANLFLLSKKYREAAEILRNCPLSDLDSHSQMLLGDLQAIEGNYDAAIAAYKKSVNSDSSNLEARLKAAQLLSQKKEYGAAIEEYEKLIKARPHDSQLQRKLALLLFWNGGERKAIETMQKALFEPLSASVVDSKNFISDYDALLFIARTMGQISELKGEAVKQYRSLLKAYPEEICLNQELGLLLLELKMFGEAQAEFDKILKAKPEDKMALFCKGKAYFLSRKFGQAVSIFKDLDRLYHSDDEVVLELARAYNANGEYAESVKIYKHLIGRMKRRDGQILMELGNLYLTLGDLKRALYELSRAYHAEPENIKIASRYALALSWNRKYADALPLLKKINAKHPQNVEVGIELARVNLKLGNSKEAEKILKDLACNCPYDSRIPVEMAEMDLYRHNIYVAKEQFEKILQIKGAELDKDFLLSYAGALASWGDFYKAAKICRENSSDPRFELKLAEILASSERYEEAKGLYMDLLAKDAYRRKAALGLIDLMIAKREYRKALLFAAGHLKAGKRDKDLFIIAKLEFLNGDYRRALGSFEKLPLDKFPSKDSWIGMIYQKLGENRKAASYFEKRGSDVEARFSLKLLKGEPVRFKGLSARQYQKLGDLGMKRGLHSEAISFYTKALKIDPNLFAAQMGLLQALAIDHDYASSLAMIDDLLKRFEGDYKLLLWKGRVLGWAKRYDDSLKSYAILHEMDPSDPVVIREMARVATWDKKTPKALQIYAKAFSPSVDDMIRPFCKGVKISYSNPHGKPYALYESLEEHLISLPKERRAAIAEELKRLKPIYEIQKSIYQESLAKELSWDKRFSLAREELKELIGSNPENQEARFDLAQIDCVLGLKRESCDEYRELLKIDPKHSLANLALAKGEVLSHPYLDFYYYYYREKGRGDLDQASTRRIYSTVGIPIAYDHKLSLISKEWWDTPYFPKSSTVPGKDALSHPYFSQGYAACYEGTFSPYVRGFAEFSQKFFRTHRFSDKTFGNGGLALNFFDYFHLMLRYDRDEQIDNYFSLLNSIMYHRFACELTSDLNRKVFLDAFMRYYVYSDNNSLDHEWAKLQVALTDHPAQLKLGVIAEHEDAKRMNVYIYDGPSLIEIIHPYWTPKRYVSARFQMEWFHDLSSHFFCGNDLAFYDLKFNTGTDTEDNPMFSLEGQLHVEFKNHYMFLLEAMLHRSRIWNAESVRVTLRYQF